jgi:6-phosphofructokinase 2
VTRQLSEKLAGLQCAGGFPVQPIVTLTLNPSLDIATSVATVVPEHKLRCAPPTYEPGGGGLNVARAIHKLGGSATACYFAGGYTGSMLTQMLTEAGIAQCPIPIHGHTRESFAVFEESSTQQYRFSTPGPLISAEECEQMMTTLSALSPSPAYVVISGSLPPGMPTSIFDQFADMAEQIHARLIVDTSGPSLQAALKRGVYLIKPNYRELSLLAGHPIESDLDLNKVAESIVESGQSEVVLVSLGAAGAALYTAQGCIRYRTPTVPILSKVGAGDSMVGGTVLALARGESLIEAARFGVAAGSAAVMTPGSELCRREDAERIYAQMVKMGN